MKNKSWYRFLILVLLILVPASTALAAQDAGNFHLRLIRNFGYGGLGQIQGRFTLKIQEPPKGLEQVDFYLDGELIQSDQEAPYELKFHTSEFAEGKHEMTAVGVLADGSRLDSNRITKEFLSSEQAWSATEGLIVPLLVGVGLLTLIGVGAPLLLKDRNTFVLGKYGPAGGVVCPRCSLPFSRSIMSPNMMVGKLVRCPHCSKISILPRASTAALQEAEERFRVKDGTTPVQTASDLAKQIEDSRYED